MIYAAVAMILAATFSAVFLGLAPLASGGKGKLYVEGRLPGFLHLCWFAFKVWAILKLGGWA